MLAKNSSLIIEGGGLRGIFAAGVIDCLLDNNIFFSHCIGVSAGACHACSYVSRQRGRAYDVSVDYLHFKGYGSWSSLIRNGDFFSPDLLYNKIPNELNLYDYRAAKDSGTVFQTVITNCITGKAEYPTVAFTPQDMIYINASSSLPLFANTIKINGKPYLDGGIADSIPVKYVYDCGYRKNLAVLTQPKGYVKQISRALPLIRRKYTQYPKLIEAMANRHTVYNETLKFIEKQEADGELFVIRPASPIDIGRIEKNKKKLKTAYESGYYETENRINMLKSFLNK